MKELRRMACPGLGMKICARLGALSMLWLASGPALDSALALQADPSNTVESLTRGGEVETAPSPQAQLAELAAGDADLNDIALITDDRLCAVGDCGAILLSVDAGRQWSEIPSRTAANLHAVTFFDEERGVIVGSLCGAYTRTSRAVVLLTDDGGQSWNSITQSLPGFVGLQRSADVLVAWGTYSPSHRSGIFLSRDQGRSWQPQPTRLGHIEAMAVMGEQFVACDGQGRVEMGRLGREGGRAVSAPESAGQLEFLSATTYGIFAGGSDGKLQFSRDGQAWTGVALPLSSEARSACQWRSLTQQGEDLWLCGSPGSIVLQSRDGGSTWSIHATEQTLPISQVRFRDAARGWATGPLGRILATRDGGRTWYHQRANEVRVGLLSLAPHWRSIPWPALIATAWGDRRTTVNLLATGTASGIPGGFLLSSLQSLSATQPRLGVSGRRFPISADASPGVLALHLLVWRPTVVLACDPEDAEGAKRSWNQNVLAAVSLANQKSSLAQELQLPAWPVEKLVVQAEHGNAEYTEQGQRVLQKLGLAIQDVALALPVDARREVVNCDLRTLWASSSNHAAKSTLMGGVAASSHTQRHVELRELGSFQLVMGRVHRENSLQRLVSQSLSAREWQQSFDFLVSSLPEHEVEAAIVHLAEQLWDPQVLPLRATVLERLVELRPHSDAARWALLERLKMLGSEEMRAWGSHGNRQTRPLELTAVDATKPVVATETPWNSTPFAGRAQEQMAGTPPVQLAAATSPAKKELLPEAEIWFQELGKLARMDATAVERPDVVLLEHRMSDFLPVERVVSDRFVALAKQPQLLGWQQAARRELQLDNHALDSTGNVAFAVRTQMRPQLDGKLSESFWHAVPPMTLTLSDTASTDVHEAQADSELHWGYDTKYLYLGIVCPHQRTTVPQVQRVRSYDADLTGLDHLAFLLDTDRDYATSVEMAVAMDGRTYDRCCGRGEFDPKWHVSVDVTPEFWVAEIAIELKYLTTDADLAGDAWGVGARRSQPQMPITSWNLPGSKGQLRPENSGLLLFLPEHD